MPTIDDPNDPEHTPDDPERTPATGYWPRGKRGEGGWPNMEDPWTLAAAPPRGPRKMITWKQTPEEEDRDWLNRIQFRQNAPIEDLNSMDKLGEAIRDMMDNPEIIAGPGIDEPEPKPKTPKPNNKTPKKNPKKKPKKKPNLPEPPV